MTDDSDGPWVFRDHWTTTHPDHPVMDDVSETVLDDAVVQLTLAAPIVAAAGDQDHMWQDIARQLQITPATARRHYGELERQTQTTPT